MTYLIHHHDLGGMTRTSIIRRDEDGREWWLGAGEADEGYLAWVAAGNTPTEWSPE